MKNFRQKFISLVLCICMCIGVLTGCSLFTKKQTIDRSATALVIGDTKITNGEILDEYYNFYQQNYYYYSYYDEETILDVFYQNIISRQIILYEAKKLLADNENKLMVFTAEDLQDVWDDVFDAIFQQIDTKEKAILLSIDDDEEKLPSRLKTDDDQETKYLFEPYEFEPVEKKDNSDKENVSYPTSAEIDVQIEKLKEQVYYYNTAKEEDEERNMQAIAESEHANRERAYNAYLADLIMSAKLDKKPTDVTSVLKARVEELLKSYYENKLYTLYQEYINSTIVDAPDETGLLGNAAIAKKFRRMFREATEKYSFEDSYVSAITSTSNSDVVLYHYDGQGAYTYFSVQHILIPFSDESLEKLKDIPGYDASKPMEFREYYEAYRQTLVDEDNMKVEARDFSTGLPQKENDEVVKLSINDILNLYNEEYTARSESIDTSDAEQVRELRTALFNEFAWRYSSDTGSLKNGLDGAFGFTISSKKDDHGSYVKDFTNGARKLYEAYEKDKVNNDIGKDIEIVVSDYGVHLMMLTGVFEQGPVIQNVETMSDDELVAALKNTKVSYLTTETLYQYVYDLLKEELVGSSGTFFTDYRNELIKQYEDDELYKFEHKLGLKELNSSVNG